MPSLVIIHEYAKFMLRRYCTNVNEISGVLFEKTLRDNASHKCDIGDCCICIFCKNLSTIVVLIQEIEM